MLERMRRICRVPHLPCSADPPAGISVCGLSAPTGGDRAGSALVPAVRRVLSRCRRVARRSRIEVDQAKTQPHT